MIARTLFALVTLASLALPAPAAAQGSGTPVYAALKRSVVVKDNLVRIGDLFDHAGALAGVPVFRAPDIGTTGTVSTAKVLDAVRPHDLFAIDTGDIAEVEVTRAGRWIPAVEIEAAVTRAFAGQHGLGEAKTLALTFDREIRAMSVEPTAGELAVARASYDARSGRFDVTLDVPNSALARRLPLRVTGTLTQMVEVLVLTRSLARGELLKDGDLAVERRAKSEALADVATPADKVAGLSARQALRAGAPLRRADLVKPELVKRDETVTITYEVPGIVLTTRGKALESGAEGDVVSVLNMQSKRTVQGIVAGPGRVVMTAAKPVVASAEPTGDARARSE